MKKYFRITLCCMLFLNIGNLLFCIPADPKPKIIQQPDGTTLTIRLIGDEFLHFNTTEDGYTILQNPEGYFTYAVKESGIIIPSEKIARDINHRSSSDIQFLNSLNKYLSDDPVTTRTQTGLSRSVMSNMSKIDASSVNIFRGVVILAQFSDKTFQSSTANNDFGQQINQPGYNLNDATGSVFDYFQATSLGQFEPYFDVVGPVTLDYRQTDAGGTDNAQALVRQACEKADQFVDFSNYDTDGDGYVDLVYVIFAGVGSNVVGNNSNFIWPHAYGLSQNRIQLDGVYCDRYACSTELLGSESNNQMDGIGTVCHEFSHILGLPDFYDTDYAGSGGESAHPGEWTIMASGGHLNQSRTPPLYSAFERYMVGWCEPEEITGGGNFTLENISVSNEAYFISSKSPDEYFFIENRQQVGWDRYLPGHGMLVHRVDLTNTQVWDMNTVNANPSHQYYELLRADNTTTNGLGSPFPGMANITILSDDTNPSLCSWAGVPSEMSIINIAENNGIISFDVDAVEVSTQIEDFEKINKTTTERETVSGNYGDWIFLNARTYDEAELGFGFGDKVASVGNGRIEMAFDLEYSVRSIVLYACKAPENTSMKTIRIEYSTDRGTTWQSYGSNIILSTAVMTSFSVNNTIEGPVRFRIVGVGPSEGYIDNFTIRYDVPSSVGENREYSSLTYIRDNDNILIETNDMISPIEIFTVSGQKTATLLPLERRVSINLPGKGIYIIRQGRESIKLIY